MEQLLQLGDEDYLSLEDDELFILAGWGAWVGVEMGGGKGAEGEDATLVKEVVRAVKEELQLWDHQARAIEVMLLAPWWRGIHQLPTGSGKTKLALGLILSYRRATGDAGPWLYLAPNKQLLRQVEASAEKMGIGGITYSTYGCLERQVNWAEGERIGVCGVIGDEVHTAVTANRLPALLSIRSKLWCGLSGTPTMRSNGGNSLVIGAFGPMLTEVTVSEFVHKGMLPGVNVQEF